MNICIKEFDALKVIFDKMTHFDYKANKRVGYGIAIMRKYAYLVVNPNTVYSCNFLFFRTTMGQASESRMALT